jgi:3',5'-cyclic AMP phosphodiesterase CpdA
LKKIIVISDLHINSTVALCKPSVQLDDGQEVKISKAQRWFWDNWLDLMERVDAYKPDVLIINGDTLEGDTKKRSYQLITRNPATIVGIGSETLEPLVSKVPAVYFIRGTGAHGGKSGFLEEDLARDFDNSVKVRNNFSHWSLNVIADGVRISAAHHATMGGLPWTKANAANALAARIQFQYSQDGERAPDIVLRGHVHRWGDSYDAYRTRAIVTPCWSLATEHIHKIAPDTLPECGAVFITCDAGKYEVEKIKYEPKGRVWVRI